MTDTDLRFRQRENPGVRDLGGASSKNGPVA